MEMRINRPEEKESVIRRLAQTRILAMDVDGVLTDGALGYGSDGVEQKRFHVSDGLGLVVMHMAGIKVVWISGRANPIVEKRASELKVFRVLQGVRDKGAALLHLCEELGARREEVTFIGDDWNDLQAFEVAGTCIAVANAAEEVRSLADATTENPGGRGAVREVCNAILDARGDRESCLRLYLDSLREAQSSDSTQ
jgi:3-deoxy-D-manno-octulosonate 8-phosphate phosphatase (KDO 8-P phosphatase)